MKAKNEYTTLTQVNTGIAGYYVPPSRSLYDSRDVVTRAHLVSGDHKTPNAWDYETKFSVWPSGHAELGWYNSAPDGSIGPVVGVWSSVGPREGFSSWGSISDACPWAPSESRPAWLYNSALERLYEQLRGSLDLSIALGEAGTTARMIQSYTRWDRFVASLPRVRRKEDLYFFFPKLIGNSYLQWTYGWKPLISDVYNALDEAVHVTLSKLYVKASATEKYDNTFARAFPFDDNPIGRYARKGGQTVRFKCMFAVPDSRFSLERWTSLNPVTIAWELMPYSFVVDWFLDVGSALRSLESALLYRTYFRGGYQTWLQWYDTAVTFDRYRAVNSFGTWYTYKYTSGMIAYERYRRFQRFVLSVSPRPRVPAFHVDLGWRRLLSSAALLGQRLGRT